MTAATDCWSSGANLRPHRHGADRANDGVAANRNGCSDAAAMQIHDAIAAVADADDAVAAGSAGVASHRLGWQPSPG